MDLQALLSTLADGDFHSGEHIAAEAGLTRAAVWKNVRKLSRWGLSVEAAPGRGYRLSEALELLDPGRLYESVCADRRFPLDVLEVFTELDSTNRFLMNNPPRQPGVMRVCFAEWQSAGRGRLERRWHSPLGSGVCLSAAWIYDGVPRDFSALSLSVGAAVATAIRDACGVAVQLKWPNDVLWCGRKLGGVLVESRIEAQGRCSVVVGVGVNVALPSDVMAKLSDWPGGAADLRTAGAGTAPDRHALAGALATELGALLSGMQAQGAGYWLQQWRAMDYLRGRYVTVTSETESLEGLAAGIDDDGALRVAVGDDDMRRVVAGDASVRA